MATAATESRRRNGNGSMRSHAKHVRDDMITLQKDLSQLKGDMSSMFGAQVDVLSKRASAIGEDALERFNTGRTYVEERVQERPFAAIGVAAGAGLLAGLLLGAFSRR